MVSVSYDARSGLCVSFFFSLLLRNSVIVFFSCFFFV